MWIRRSHDEIIVWAPAKLNLFLEVLGRRNDGLHEIETLIVPVDLYDTLVWRDRASGEVTLTCVDDRQRIAGEGTGERLPEGLDNIVVRAVERLRGRSGVAGGGDLTLIKRIPWQAGLAGGSSDAAAALMAANLAWRLGWSSGRLAELGAELGSDIPFFLAGGPAICRGRGERVEPLAGLGAWHFVVVHPPAGLATADVYRACRPAATPRRADELVAALRRGNGPAVGRSLVNRLASAAMGLAPAVGKLRDLFAEFDLVGHQMTGSGSSYFGVCRHARQARRLASALQGQGVGRVYAVRSCA